MTNHIVLELNRHCKSVEVSRTVTSEGTKRTWPDVCQVPCEAGGCQHGGQHEAPPCGRQLSLPLALPGRHRIARAAEGRLPVAQRGPEAVVPQQLR